MIWPVLGKALSFIGGKALSFLGGKAVGNLIAGGVSSAANYLGSKQQFKWQKELNKDSYNYNLSLQKQAQQWQQKNITSAHQQEVADMRKAGLNPILSATGGSGAAVGSVGASSVGAGSAPDLDIDPVSAWATAKQVNSTANLNDSQRSLNRSQEGLNETSKNLNNAYANQSKKQSEFIDSQNQNEIERKQNIIAERAKTLQDIQNSKEITSAQVQNIKSQTALNNIDSLYRGKRLQAEINELSSRSGMNTSAASSYQASAYYNRNRSLGYSNSSSKNEGGSFGIGFGPFKINYSNNKSRGHSTNY